MYMIKNKNENKTAEEGQGKRLKIFWETDILRLQHPSRQIIIHHAFSYGIESLGDILQHGSGVVRIYLSAYSSRDLVDLFGKALNSFTMTPLEILKWRWTWFRHAARWDRAVSHQFPVIKAAPVIFTIPAAVGTCQSDLGCRSTEDDAFSPWPLISQARAVWLGGNGPNSLNQCGLDILDLGARYVPHLSTCPSFSGTPEWLSDWQLFVKIFDGL